MSFAKALIFNNLIVIFTIITSREKVFDNI
jgi:hypothetical protein